MYGNGWRSRDGMVPTIRAGYSREDCWDVFRIITGCVRSGEAAGAAAAYAAQNEVLPRDVDGADIRRLMEDITFD